MLDITEVGAGHRRARPTRRLDRRLRLRRLVAVEGAKGFGLALTRQLLDAGESVVDIATHLTAQGRRSSRRRGKDDEIDADHHRPGRAARA